MQKDSMYTAVLLKENLAGKIAFHFKTRGPKTSIKKNKGQDSVMRFTIKQRL